MQKILSFFPVPSEVSAQLSFKNLVRNGNLDIWQRGTTFANVPNSTHTADGFQLIKVATATGDISQQLTDVPTLSSSQIYSGASLRHRVVTPQTTIDAAQYYVICQRIEGYIIRILRGNPFTLSFWVKSTVPGRYCVAFRNGTADSTQVREYTIDVANTWEKKVITVSVLPTVGTWNLTNGTGLFIGWVLATGVNHHTTPNVWQAGGFLSTANQINAVGTTGNDFSLAQIQLELGAVATELEFRPFVKELLLAKRYYNTLGLSAGGYTPGMPNGMAVSTFNFSVPMRTTPTARLVQAGTRVGLDLVAANSIVITVPNADGGAITVYPNQSGTGAANFSVINDLWSFTADI